MDKSEEELAWEQENEVVIDYVQQSDAEEAKEFLYENFYKDEPLFKSFKILNINGWFDRYMLKEVDKFLIHQPIAQNEKKKASLVAKCTKTGKIVGTRFGEIVTRETLKVEPKIYFLGEMPKFVPVPEKLRKQAQIQKIFDTHLIGQEHVFKHPDTKESKAIYFGHNVCVGRAARGKGLGLEMVKRSQRLAEANGCSHTYIIATGKFSQRIFHKLNYKPVYEIKYADIEKDKRGRPFIDDHGVHEIIQTVIFRHALKSHPI